MKIAALVVFLMVSTVGWSQSPEKTETIVVNGHKVYYEVYGKGSPLLLLHGYTLSMKSWHSLLPYYTDNYEVYLVDLQGHGKSGPYTGKLSIKSAAEDVEGLITHLKLESIDAIGFSMGGDVLFQLALLRPGLLKSLISIGACGTWQSRNFPDWGGVFNYSNVQNLPWMKEHQTSDEQIKIMLDQFPNYDVVLTDEQIRSIAVNTLIVVGDRDTGITMECLGNLRRNLPQSSLWILPNTGHVVHDGKHRAEFVKVSKDFMMSKMK
jgi:pimeloyl-ACP methyl ester carboxylesterase